MVGSLQQVGDNQVTGMHSWTIRRERGEKEGHVRECKDTYRSNQRGQSKGLRQVTSRVAAHWCVTNPCMVSCELAPAHPILEALGGLNCLTTIQCI